MKLIVILAPEGATGSSLGMRKKKNFSDGNWQIINDESESSEHVLYLDPNLHVMEPNAENLEILFFNVSLGELWGIVSFL